MQRVVLEVDRNTFRELVPGLGFTDKTGIHHGWNVTQLWDQKELANIGVYWVEEPQPGPGEELIPGTFRKYERQDGMPVCTLQFRPKKIEPAPPESNTIASVFQPPKTTVDLPFTWADIADIPAAKKQALKDLEALVTQARADIGPLTPLQDMVYEMKYREAQSFMFDSSGEVVPFKYPFLSEALASGEGKDAHDLAQTWIDKAQLFRILLAKVEARRIKAKRAINVAKNLDQIGEALRAFG